MDTEVTTTILLSFFAETGRNMDAACVSFVAIWRNSEEQVNWVAEWRLASSRPSLLVILNTPHADV